ncbi:zinc finger CCCH domain-containing protein 14 isoform X2 [Callorhinchus milii]|uniref:Zinc finger CCCH domain-containing protein 14 n=2 Tax=Callorhinchus milii TaxID=7868 RepID=V9KH71_CALMI|nr:zinc finger CCCH domain-containing protein 14 isoform X2 [Callorhinchus milii]
MEIGTEISRKIRTAIKGKLQELGAYADEELPDYIMVMVANKKSQQQMTDDLSLFLGTNTVKFTIWLHGVLDKLRSATVEPTGLKSASDYTDSILFSSSEKIQAAVSGSSDLRIDDVRKLAVSSTRFEKNDSRVTTSSLHEQTVASVRPSSTERNASQLMSTVKPLMEPVSSEAVIDIKPELDDLIDDDLNILQDLPAASKKKPVVTFTYNVSHPTFEGYRPSENVTQHCRASESSVQSYRVPQNNVQACRLGESNPPSYRPECTGHTYRSPEGVLQTYNRLSDSGLQIYRSSKSSVDRPSRDDETARKRKGPIISSVVKVNKTSDGEDEEDDYGSRTGSLPSSISVPAKPERRPTLPPSKQANKNLILKAITEAQKSVCNTTNYPQVFVKQTVPVAPRTRAQQDTEVKVIEVEDKPQQPGSPLQIDVDEQLVQKHYLKPIETRISCDTRSFILKKSVLEEVEPQLQVKETICPEAASAEQARVIQTKDQNEPEESSPKFIVTLDGIPSPPGYVSEQEEETEPLEQEAGREYRLPIQTVTRPLKEFDEEIDEDSFQPKRQKVAERCKYWPACKNGDECMYHHPIASCKTFPNCKFGDKCLFIHPNCKYDSKCTRPDCPYTHASRRSQPLLKQPAVISSGSSLCRFFPECKKVECPFIHPKPCRFGTHCKRADCTFYHPVVTLPPRHALKWTRSQQNSE